MTVSSITKRIHTKWEELGYRDGAANRDPHPPSRPDELSLEEAYKRGWWKGFEEFRIKQFSPASNVVNFRRET